MKRKKKNRTYLLGVGQADLPVLDRVEDSRVQHAALDVGLQARVLLLIQDTGTGRSLEQPLACEGRKA